MEPEQRAEVPAEQQQPTIIVQQSVGGQQREKKVNHVLHLILTILTGGLWGIVWIVLAIKNS